MTDQSFYLLDGYTKTFNIRLNKGRILSKTWEIYRTVTTKKDTFTVSHIDDGLIQNLKQQEYGFSGKVVMDST